MKEEQKVIELDSYEEGAIIEGLNRIRTQQLSSNGTADFVSDLMLRIMKTPQKKVRVRNETR